MGEKIKTSEGGGGEATGRLLSEHVFKFLTHGRTEGGLGLEAADDGAVIRIGDCNVVFTTDSYVVQPVFFRGGDIGKLAVTGTINDLAVMGGRPIALSLALVLSEGFEKQDLERIIQSAAKACEEVGAAIVTGDTKVIDSREPGIMINTSGIGIADKVISDAGSVVGDVILLSGGIGEHGVAVLSEREGIKFDTQIVSDCREVWTLVRDLLESGVEIHAAKDPTRGGIAAVLNEMAVKSRRGFAIDEQAVPLADGVRSACEMLGLDPFEIANEGKVIVCVAQEHAEKAIGIMKARDAKAGMIGKVTEEHGGEVILETVIGGRRILRMPLGDPIPRVC